ncbi:hypothetical protein C8R45DRAFT_989264 [Mycena sanguinolenta]|nr:hypothetical protein C8R45DRAFT_989264 [Mycena sanguinolenta]
MYPRAPVHLLCAMWRRASALASFPLRRYQVLDLDRVCFTQRTSARANGSGSTASTRESGESGSDDGYLHA